MRSVLVLVFAFALAASVSFVQANGDPQAPAAANPKPVFSGTWILDVGRSWIATPDREPLPPETLVVKQTGKALTIVGDLPNYVADRSVAIGSPRRFQQDGMTFDVESKWNNDRLVVTMTLSRPGFIRNSIQVWSLGGDGDELTIEGSAFALRDLRPNEVARSDVKMKRVYRKR
jgi:hypothetical protein